jgi:hypothetical protein
VESRGGRGNGLLIGGTTIGFGADGVWWPLAGFMEWLVADFDQGPERWQQ